MKKVDHLREKHPRFIYQNFQTRLLKRGLKITFDFRIQTARAAPCNCSAIKEPDPLPETSFRYGASIYFKPAIVIKGVKQSQLKRVGENVINNLAFHLGLIEMLSYWKATSSPEIIIGAGQLNKEQIKWWKKVIEKGMGQFFYENKINFRKPNFLKFKVSEDCPRTAYKNLGGEKILVPIGGGKDSIVTLELLKKSQQNIQCFSLNPLPSAKKIMGIASCQQAIVVERKIDRQLLKLNKEGFLNGHTPFSAYLAFLSVFVAVLFNSKYIAFSNERSSNQGNVKYLGKIINHQWSKSFEFEKMFREYSQKYLAKNVEYFSFLRPLYEIQIAKIFSQYPKYFSAFLSCNEPYKILNTRYKIQDTRYKQWCGKCPKCLFVFAILYPFLKEQDLIKVFGQNLFEKRKLLPLMQQLIGERGFKPFECVGTKKETLVAFYLCLKKQRERFSLHSRGVREQFSDKLPFLLDYFEKKVLPKYPHLPKETSRLLNSWNKNNFLPKNLAKVLKKNF